MPYLSLVLTEEEKETETDTQKEAEREREGGRKEALTFKSSHLTNLILGHKDSLEMA